MENNPFRLDNKRILITGASSGIGQQIAIDCSQMGAQLILLGRNNERLQETLSLMKPNSHTIISHDINDIEYIESFLKGEESLLPLDGFVHSAGIEKTLPLKNLKAKDYIELYETNFISSMMLLKFFTKKNNYNPGFKAVFISSITSVIARLGTLAYTASKGALVAAVRELAVELASKQINVNCISPGTILTPLMEKYLDTLTAEERDKRLSGFPLGIGQPSDISNTTVFLLSEAARWITGQNIIVDGGYTIQ